MKKISENKKTSILKKEFTIPFFNMKNFKKIFGELKNRKKSHIYKRKRKTFRGLLTKNILIGLFLTVVFAVGLFNVGKEYIFSQAERNCYNNLSNMQGDISRNTDEQLHGPQELSARMKIYTHLNVVLDNMGKYQMNHKTENCHVFMRLTDKDRNIISSSRMGLTAFIISGKDDKEYFLCDTENKEIPELQQLEEDYMKMAEKEDSFYSKYTVKDYYVCMGSTMKSAYINREEGLFIPHEIELNLIKHYSGSAYPSETLETKSCTINIPEKYKDYEFIEFDSSSSDTYPRCFMYNFFGTEKDAFDRLNAEYPPIKNQLGSRGNRGMTQKIYQQNAEVYINGEPHILTSIIQVDAWNSVTKLLYFKLVIIFLIVMLAIALFDAWRHNVRNQADYNFEDYQKNLTDSLAHDLKTPLMAIGGYVENIMTGNLNDEETNKYLSAIMDNITYTDSIITNTLELNAINGMNIKPVQIDLRRIVNNAVEKYSLLLDKKNISVHTDGTGEITADTATLKNIIENLISNAVNYTTENGKINISISNENMIIKNTIDKKIDVKELKKPFKKGDKARSNSTGSGLGLAIADNSAMINGFKLDISCSDTEFKSEVKF